MGSRPTLKETLWVLLYQMLKEQLKPFVACCPHSQGLPVCKIEIPHCLVSRYLIFDGYVVYWIWVFKQMFLFPPREIFFWSLFSLRFSTMCFMMQFNCRHHRTFLFFVTTGDSSHLVREAPRVGRRSGRLWQKNRYEQRRSRAYPGSHEMSGGARRMVHTLTHRHTTLWTLPVCYLSGICDRWWS